MEDILKENNIVVITGPMKSGKTKLLIEYFNFYKDKYSCGVFKPEIDTRFSQTDIVDRDGGYIEGKTIRKLYELERYQYLCNLFFIDEFQFLSGNVETILKISSSNKKFIISGLSLTSENEPFGLMGNILCCADKVIVKQGICEECGKPSKFTYYNGKKTSQILVGDNVYKSLCYKCYYKR